MPGTRKKNFKRFRDVAKEGAMHFEVGHRSQRDPMLADTEASEHVLVPRELATRDKEKQWEEQMKYGVYYEDDYDYLQHLRDVNEIRDSEMNQLPGFQMKEDYDNDGAMSVSMASTTASRLTIPSSVLGSAAERDVGLLELQAAENKEDWDPEVLAALDDNFDFEDPGNCLDDDFMLKANADAEPIDEDEEEDEEGEETESADEGEEEEEGVVKQSDEKVKGVSEWIQRMQLEKKCAGEDDNDDDDDDDDDEDGSDFGSEGMVSDDDDGSEFSMGRKAQQVSKYSAAMKPRNENLQLIDQMHEELLKREYTEDQVGALDGEQVGGRGTFDGELWKQVERDFYKSQETFTMREVFNSEERVRPVLPEKLYYVEDKDYSVEEDIDCSQQPLSTPAEPEYNVETIRSTYPKNKFKAAQVELPAHLRPKGSSDGTGSQRSVSEVSQLPGLTLKEVDRQQRMERLADAPSTFRPKAETPEERKERKRQVKEMKRERREEKSLNKAAYKSEELRQKKQREERVKQKAMITVRS